MHVAHFVAFKLKSEIGKDEEQRNQIRSDFLHLKTACKKDGAPYILELNGNVNMSPEGQHKDMDLGFLVTFASVHDRDYYLNECPTHIAFADSVRQKTTDAFIFDFEY